MIDPEKLTWHSMDTVKKDGSRIDIQTKIGVVAYDLFYGRPPMGYIGEEAVLRGDMNVVFLTPVAWRPTVTEGMTMTEKQLIRGEQK